MADFKLTAPLSVPMMLLVPKSTAESYGVRTKVYPELKDGIPINGSFRTFGGTEIEINGVLSIENTAKIDTWYRPDITSDCRVGLLQTGQIYEILGEPENIQMRNQYMRLKVRLIEGGV